MRGEMSTGAMPKAPKNKAQAFVEFLITLPIILLLSLGGIQLAYLIKAHQIVKLAAFRAARSLIVNINDLSTEQALLRMKESARLNLVSLAPSLNSSESLSLVDKTSTGRLKDVLPYSAIYGLKGGSTKDFIKRYLYTLKFSKISIKSPKDIFQIKRGDKILILVEYLFSLDIPLAGRTFYEIINQSDSKSTLSKHRTLKGRTLYQTKICKEVFMQSEK